MRNYLFLKTIFRTLAGLSIFLLLVASNAFGQQQNQKGLDAKIFNAKHHDEHRSLAEITNQADLIAVGKVTNLTSEWDESKSRIRTRVTISTEEAIKGSAPSSSITVVIPGGEVDGIGEWYSHSVKFQKEEEVVVFVKKEKTGHYTVIDGDRGKLPLVKNVKSGKKIIPSIGSLDELKEEIKLSLKSKNKED